MPDHCGSFLVTLPIFPRIAAQPPLNCPNRPTGESYRNLQSASTVAVESHTLSDPVT